MRFCFTYTNEGWIEYLGEDDGKIKCIKQRKRKKQQGGGEGFSYDSSKQTISYMRTCQKRKQTKKNWVGSSAPTRRDDRLLASASSALALVGASSFLCGAPPTPRFSPSFQSPSSSSLSCCSPIHQRTSSHPGKATPLYDLSPNLVPPPDVSFRFAGSGGGGGFGGGGGAFSCCRCCSFSSGCCCCC